MRVLLAVTVLALAVLATAEPGLLDKLKKAAPKSGPKDLFKRSNSVQKPPVGSSKKSSNSSSSASHVDPKLMAKEIIAVFGDADGSAFFKGNKILPHTVAEVPPRKKAPARPHASSRSSSSSDSSQSLRFREPIASPPVPRQKRPGSSSVKRVLSRHSSSRSSARNPRHNRPLFNFNSVPAGVTGVGLRKHSFGTKHHTLLVRFANSHPKVTTVIVVDKFVGPNGRPSKNKSDARRRGRKQSDLKIANLKHKNLFVFNEHSEQVFPAKAKLSSSSRSLKPKHSSSSVKSKLGLMDQLKKKMSPKF